MAEKKYFWLKMPRNFFEKHYIKILRAKDNGDLLVMFLSLIHISEPTRP